MAYSKTITEAFWSHVDKGGPVPAHMPHLGGCWLWTGFKDKDGYGGIRRQEGRICAHRVSWQLHNGLIPEDTPFVLHHCDNPPCVRPDHLFVGTRGDNNRDTARKGRHFTRTRPECVVRGEQIGTSKLTAANVLAIRGQIAEGRTLTAIARNFDISRATIYYIKRGERWAHVK